MIHTLQILRIMYPSGKYHQNTVKSIFRYGLRLQVTKDEGLAKYLETVLTQLQGRDDSHNLAMNAELADT